MSYVVVVETDDIVVIPRFKVFGPFEKWVDASTANAILGGEIDKLLTEEEE